LRRCARKILSQRSIAARVTAALGDASATPLTQGVIPLIQGAHR
jgi:hypothetical protein